MKLKTSDFDYHLPPEYIAQTPVEPRDAARLLVLNRQTGEITHVKFWDVGEFLFPGDLLVINDTRVLPARLYARKIPTGGRVELLLLKRIDEKTWESLVGGKGLSVGKQLEVENSVKAEVIQVMDGGRRIIRFDRSIDELLHQIGHVPSPPYIHAPLADSERYQTVYAHHPGSSAAPTAGLHFTPRLIEELKVKGVNIAKLVLHVGLDTFAPVMEDDPARHKIHTEWCQLNPETAEVINTTRDNGGRIVAVGTTTVRVLETAARHTLPDTLVRSVEGPTDLFILPGCEFQVLDPRSTLLMLVSAFAGRERVLTTYQLAINQNYRFYSFGDAMLIL
jgi:S-adenosylmethionine:tRNA ribosyltransferase-isomerase